jgi:hypothetical protein
MEMFLIKRMGVSLSDVNQMPMMDFEFYYGKMVSDIKESQTDSVNTGNMQNGFTAYGAKIR